MALFRPYQPGASSKSKDDTSAQSSPSTPPKEPAATTPSADVSANAKDSVTPSGASDSNKGHGSNAPEAHSSTDSSDAETATSASPKKKSGPTPTRREAEAARMERLHPDPSSKEAKRREREARREQQRQALSKAEDSKTRVLLRNYIDSRWTISEFLLPLMLVILALSLGGSTSLAVQQMTSIAMMTLFFLWILETWRLWRGFKKELHSRYPNESTQGLLMYFVNRLMTIRRFRRPAPVISRREKY